MSLLGDLAFGARGMIVRLNDHNGFGGWSYYRVPTTEWDSEAEAIEWVLEWKLRKVGDGYGSESWIDEEAGAAYVSRLDILQEKGERPFGYLEVIEVCTSVCAERLNLAPNSEPPGYTFDQCDEHFDDSHNWEFTARVIRGSDTEDVAEILSKCSRTIGEQREGEYGEYWRRIAADLSRKSTLPRIQYIDGELTELRGSHNG